MFTQLRKWWRIIRISNLIYGIILGVVSSLIATILVANYPLLAEPVQKFIIANLGWLIALAALIIASLTTILYYVNAWRRDREIWNRNLTDLDGRLKALTANLGWGDQLLDVVDSLLSHLPELLATRNLQNFKKFMHDLLSDATVVITKTVPGVYGASLYRPYDEENLKIWISYQVPEDSRMNATCYIGSKTDRKRGVAGECFCEKTVVVAHKTKGLAFDRESYLHFGNPGTHPAFESFICVPVKTETSDCYGVLCFDSLYMTVFDNIELQKAIQRLGQIIALVIILYEGLEKPQSTEAV